MVLADYQRRLLSFIFGADGTEAPPWDTILWSEPKKSGKSALAAAVARWVAETFEPFNEVYCLANDFEQAQGRNYAAIRDSIEMATSPTMTMIREGVPLDAEVVARAEAWRTAGRLMRYNGPTRGVGSFVQALSSDYRGAAGGNPGMILYSELWGYVSEGAKRLYGEMTTVPTRQASFRWVETYAGWLGESVELYRLYEMGQRGREVPELGLFDAKGNCEVRVNEAESLLMFWSHTARQPWQTPTYYQRQRANLRDAEYARFHRNEWATREGGFVEPSEWDSLGLCSTLDERMARWRSGDPKIELIVGVDASKNRACTALIGVVADQSVEPPAVEVCHVRIWGAEVDEELGGAPMVDLDQTVGKELYRLESHPAVKLVTVVYDPYQLHSIMVTFARKAGSTDVVEVPQTEKRVQTDTAFRDLIRTQRVRQNGDVRLREHILNAVGLERTRGIRIDKESTSLHVDGAVAASMASWASLFYTPRPERSFLKL